MVLLVETVDGKPQAAGQETHNRVHFARATADERQAIVDQAHFLLVLDSCRQYGLISVGPAINCHSCMQVIELGEEYGIVPTNELPPSPTEGEAP